MNLNIGTNNFSDGSNSENSGSDESNDQADDIFSGAQAGNIAGANASNPELELYKQELSMRFERNEHFMALSKEGLPIPRFISTEKDHFEFFTSSNRRKFEN